jgi:hypothetical protein
MEFLTLRMGGEETITFTMASLGLTPKALTSVYTNKHSSKQYLKEEVPTAAGLPPPADASYVKVYAL